MRTEKQTNQINEKLAKARPTDTLELFYKMQACSMLNLRKTIKTAIQLLLCFCSERFKRSSSLLSRSFFSSPDNGAIARAVRPRSIFLNKFMKHFASGKSYDFRFSKQDSKI
jgi:hypothetical protein